MKRMTLISPSWGYPTAAVALVDGAYYDVRDNGFGGYVVDSEIPKSEMKHSTQRADVNAETREAMRAAVEKYLHK